MELLTAMYLLSLPFIFKIVYLFFIVVPFFKKTRRLYYKIFSYPLTEDNILLHDKDYLFMDLFLSLERKNVKSLRKGFDMFITYIFFLILMLILSIFITLFYPILIMGYLFSLMLLNFFNKKD